MEKKVTTVGYNLIAGFSNVHAHYLDKFSTFASIDVILWSKNDGDQRMTPDGVGCQNFLSLLECKAARG